jgi:hypothetical protein
VNQNLLMPYIAEMSIVEQPRSYRRDSSRNFVAVVGKNTVA